MARLIAALVLGSSSAACGQPSVQFLDLLPGGTSAIAYVVSNDGSIVGGTSQVGDGLRPTRWTSVNPIALPLLAGTQYGSVRAGSADGSVLVGACSPGGGNQPCRWVNGVAGAITPLPPHTQGYLWGVSADGNTYAGTSESTFTGRHFATRWVAGVPTGLGSLPGESNNQVTGMSADGSVVVGYSTTPPGRVGYRWTAAGGMQPLGPSSTFVHAVSADGSAVVGESGGLAFRWSAACGLQSLGVLPGFVSSRATAASSDGSVVVGFSHTNISNAEAFYWTAHTGIAPLATLIGAALPPNWRLEFAQGISPDGHYVVGRAVGPGGAYPGFLARIEIPVPGCYADCDSSVCHPLLTVNDFICFMNRFAAGDSYANCDASTSPPILSVNDYVCFQQRFAAGCS